MNSRTKKYFHLFVLAVIMLGFFAGCAHKKAYKKALEYEKAGRYVDAAEQDLRALDKKSDFTEAKVHLNSIAPQAYQELLGKAENFERNIQWVEAINSWKHLDILLNRFQRHGVSLTTVNIKNRLNHAKQKGTVYHYSQGQQTFQSGQYLSAIDHYKKVMTISGNYLETQRRLWESHMRVGDQKLASGDYANAIEFYQSALNYTSNPASTNPQIAEAYYRWADKYYAEKNYREATEKFESVITVAPNYRDSKKRREDSYQKALRRVAILPFKNNASTGTEYTQQLTDHIINNCIKANLKYATFMNRAHLDLILEEHKLAMAGVVDPDKATKIGKLEGIHYFITGTITQVYPKKSSPSYVDQTYDKVYSEKDTAGNTIQKTTPIKYREYSTSRSVQISASYQIVEVETGRYVNGDNFSEKILDEAHWIRYGGNVADLPKEKQKLATTKPELRSADLLIGDGLQSLSNKMSSQIVAFLK